MMTIFDYLQKHSNEINNNNEFKKSWFSLKKELITKRFNKANFQNELLEHISSLCASEQKNQYIQAYFLISEIEKTRKEK